MAITDLLLYQLAKRWPSPMAKQTRELGAEPGTEAHDFAYAQRQFDFKVKYGLLQTVLGMDVLEIGPGHGGICCFMAAVGARSVTGIDLNTKNLEVARQYTSTLSEKLHFNLPVTFLEMDGTKTTFSDARFDLVLADNTFEHFIDPQAVMQEAFRLLKPNGRLLVPIFSSIYSKYGLHLKHGLKLPWANLFFSEKTIIRAMLRLAKDDPKLFDLYPGLRNNPQRVRDLRQYKDLNDITYKKFKALACATGFRVESFFPECTRVGKVLTKLAPPLRNSILTDILSTGAGAFLRKPG